MLISLVWRWETWFLLMFAEVYINESIRVCLPCIQNYFSGYESKLFEDKYWTFWGMT